MKKDTNEFNNMKLIITESQLKKIVQSDLDEDYPQSWNIEEFRKYDQFNALEKCD